MWDIVGVMLLGYDIIGIPMVAFSPPPHPITTFMDWFTLVFWTGDMIASIVTGYIDDGVTIMDPRKILRNYLGSWFSLDCAVVGPDWAFTIIELTSREDTGEGGNLGKLLRGLRAVRVVRLLRLAKLKRVLSMIRDRIDSEYMFIVVSIFRLVLMLIAVNHYIGCMWYALGALGQNSNLPNWIDAHGMTERSFGYRYTSSLHWSLTQFTPGSMHVQPMNVIERAYSIVILIFGLILFSSFISNITASMTQLRNMQGETSRQFWLLRRFLRQQSVSHELSFRIFRYTEFQSTSGKDLVPESRVTVLNLLSEQLRNELHYVMFYSGVHAHPLFEKASRISDTLLHIMSKESMARNSLAKGDVIFQEGVSASHMYFVSRGNIRYVKPDRQDIASKSDWITEQALWTEWTHVGEARTVAECQVVAINVKCFVAVVGKDLDMHSLMTSYAHNFVNWLNALEDADLTEVFCHEEGGQFTEFIPKTVEGGTVIENSWSIGAYFGMTA
jgi:CRP-like cAMP-binding protein